MLLLSHVVFYSSCVASHTNQHVLAMPLVKLLAPRSTKQGINRTAVRCSLNLLGMAKYLASGIVVRNYRNTLNSFPPTTACCVKYKRFIHYHFKCFFQYTDIHLLFYCVIVVL